MKTTNYKGFLIDEEKEDFTGKTIFTVWDKKGVIYLTTVYSIEDAKRYIDSKLA